MAFESATLMKVEYAELSDRPGQGIAYTFTDLVPANQHSEKRILVVFVNGLGLPQAFWQPTIDLLRQAATSKRLNSQLAVRLLTYDRIGQGLSRSVATSTPKSHDILSSVQELDAMVNYIGTTYLSAEPEADLLLVSHSIGVPLSRLYCANNYNHNHVSALLALDSNMANTDFVSLMPDPDASNFDADRDLPSDTSIDQLRWTRENYRRMFHPSTPNPEGLDRRSLPSLLPKADYPVLSGRNRGQVLLTVVGHDPDTFAEESLKISTRGLTEKYMQPAWAEYNRNLLNVGQVAKEVVLATNSGHFIQRDNPKCVCEEILELIERMRYQSDIS